MSTKEKKGGASAIGSAIGVVVLVAASVTGGWVACDLWPKGQSAKMQMPQMGGFGGPGGFGGGGFGGGMDDGFGGF